jgi:hypothetical protein
MKNQSTNSTINTKHNNKQGNTKNISDHKYTEADLGEDILDISLCSTYPVAEKLVNNIYSRSYVFQC